MADKGTIAHGGALAAAVQKYGGKKADWLDLSTGINPVSAPLPTLDPYVWQALPDADLMENCLGSARHYYAFTERASLVAAPGVQALIQRLPLLRPGKTAAIIGPTYGEYAHVFQTLGSGSRVVHQIDDLLDESVVIIVNPNNPDGRIVPPEVLVKLATALWKKGGLLIVDEAFADLMPEVSVAAHAGMRGLLVLKSFGKFFGLAGVRLGFAAGHGDDINILNQHLGPWAVSGPALIIGAECLGNTQLRSRITQSVVEFAAQQRILLEQLGLKIVADTGLFQLVETSDAGDLYEALAKQHILARVFAKQPHWLRLGLCKNSTERARLAFALSGVLSKP